MGTVRVIAFLAVALACLAQSGSRTPFSTYTGWLLTTFIGLIHDDTSPQPNGPGDLMTYQSPNAANFFPTSVLPTYNCHGFLRDPSIVKFSGTYYMAHSLAGPTGTSCTPDLKSWAWTSSSDGLTWANQTKQSMSAISGVAIVGAPEWFIDPNASGLSSVHIFVDATTTATCCSNFQIYEMHPTASDFSTWSSPAAITITGESNVIDPFVVWRADTSTYYIWFRAQQGPYINYASSSTLTGTYTDVQTDTDWAGFYQGSFNIEGPCLRQIVAGSPGTWRIFYDANSSYTQGQIYVSDSTDGWSTWSHPHPITTPTQAKHGTVIPFP